MISTAGLSYAGVAMLRSGLAVGKPGSQPRNAMIMRLVQQIRATPHLREHSRMMSAARQAGRHRDPVTMASLESGDPLTQYMVLALAADDSSRDAGGQGKGQQQREAIEAAMSCLEEKNPTLRSRVHAMSSALSSAAEDTRFEDGKVIESACSAYESVLHYSFSLGSLFDILSEKYPHCFETMRVWLIKTLSDELKSGWMSCAPAQLLTVRQQLYDAQTLGLLVENAASMLRRLQLASAATRTPLQGGIRQAFDVVRDMLQICAKRYVSESTLQRLLAPSADASVAHALSWCQGLRTLCRQLPLNAFADNHQRDRVLNAWNEAFERCCANEEAAIALQQTAARPAVSPR